MCVHTPALHLQCSPWSNMLNCVLWSTWTQNLSALSITLRVRQGGAHKHPHSDTWLHWTAGGDSLMVPTLTSMASGVNDCTGVRWYTINTAVGCYSHAQVVRKEVEADLHDKWRAAAQLVLTHHKYPFNTASHINSVTSYFLVINLVCFTINCKLLYWLSAIVVSCMFSIVTCLLTVSIIIYLSFYCKTEESWEALMIFPNNS